MLQPRVLKEILVLTHDLYFPKSAIEEVLTLIEDVQSKGKEVLETSAGPELKGWRFPYIDFGWFGILLGDPPRGSHY